MAQEFTHEEKQIALLEGAVEMFKIQDEHQRAALQEIVEITENLGQFNPTYERIHNIARKGLEAIG